MKLVFVDTSGIVAAMNARDEYHARARKIFHDVARGGYGLVITNYVRAETHALLVGRAGRDIALRFLEETSWFVERVSPQDEEKAIEILRTYRDKTFSLTDATSFVVMERLGIDTAIAFDQHFPEYGVKIFEEIP